MDSNKLPVLVFSDIVIFPNNEVRFEYSDDLYKDVLNKIDKSEKKEVIIVNPIDANYSDDVTLLPNIGVKAFLKLKMNVPNGKTRVVLQGIKRVNVSNYEKKTNFYEAIYSDINEDTYKDPDEDNYFNILIKSLDRYINQVPYMSNAIISQLENVNNLNDLCDLIASFLPLNFEKKKKYITTLDVSLRTKLLIEDMNSDLKFLELERKIEDEVQTELDKTQKEFFLREKIKMIRKELGEVNSRDDEIAIFRKKLSKLKCNNKVKEKIKRELSRYEAISSNSPEVGMIRDYLDWMLSLPWGKITRDNNDLTSVYNILNSTHYGLDDVKERIIEYLAVKQNTNNSRSPILCLVGPPGVGKTSLALSIAKSLGRKSAKISVGGINDEAEIVGHRRTYIGANPGRIIQGIKKAGTINPVFIIDEIDKMTKDIKGDPASSLLEVLDPEQNNKISDHYIEEDFDLYNVLFI